ncbi:hypothetical protein AVEN_117098-1 [Araneus ventricosus]|uniref:MBD domain-containing protein n=1 Tax=Araneus ventricosus TaxID=182803 RepID=A0A4Y2KWK1_ARAVE|nr:hypothetical protein AVEN_117098-1 [Araneus ventricosus]
MDMYHANLLVPTNSRRRTKGRLPFIDSAEPVFPNDDEKLENEANIPENELEYDFSENPDDVDEEQVTIDLSEFLNENPLLTEPSENLADSGATLTDCHSQFRVTSSLADPTPVATEEISSQKDSSVVNEPIVVTEKCLDISETDTIPTTLPVSEMPPNVLSENNISIDSAKIPTDIVSNISPHKENILIKVKSSPSKNHKAKSTKATNLLQKYKNASRLKDFNKNNMKVFGKYPVVKCEKLDIENFIKTNSIKVRNWPIISTNNHFKTKSPLNKSNVTRKYKSQSNKVPKLLNKPISFNRCVSNSRNLSTVNKARSILIDALAANSSPLIIKTDNWKPEIANLTGGSNKFIIPENFQLPISQGFSKPVGNQRIIKLVHASSPLQINKLNTQTQKLPIITSVNKVTLGPKTFQLISPNTFAASKPEKNKAVTPILPKPNTEAISPVFLKDYTVIQPYVEDPTSPVKPKPLLTVPLDIVPVVNAFNQPELINAATETHSPIKSPMKSAKPVQSVFLNGAINQISTPVKMGKEPHPINMTELVHCNEETTVSNDLNKANNKSNVDLPIISPKSSMIDIVTSVFSKPQIKKQPKNKQNNLRSHRGGESSVLGCKAYNTTLNDMLFNDDFTDENYSLDDSIDMSSDTCPIDASNNILQSSQVYQRGRNDVDKSSTDSSSDQEKHKDKVFSKRKNNRKKIPTPHDSETLSASEGEEDNSRLKRLSYTKRKHKKLSVNTLHNHKKPTESPNTVPEFEENRNISREKLVVDTSTVKNASSSDKRNKLLKRAETIISSEDSPESFKIYKEKCLSSNKSSSSKPSLEESCTTSKSDTNSISNATLLNDEEKVNDSTMDHAQEKPRTVQESKIGVNNLRSRHKSTLKRQTAVALVKSKRIGYVRAKFKVNSKKPSNNKAMCNNKKSSRPADIIKEIKTITGGSSSCRRLQKKENTISEKANHFSSKTVSTRSKNESKSKTVSKAPKQTKKSLAVHSKTKKRIKTLKVLFKRPTPKQKSKSLELPFDDINLALLDNENDPNSLSENNTNLNSTFRDEKSHKMGTPSKEEHKCDAEVLPTELKSDDSLKENEILSNGIDGNSSVESSVGTEGGDFLHGENDVSTSEELKSYNISDKVKTIEDMSQNEKLNAINVSDNKQQPDTSIAESLSSPFILQENNSAAFSDSNLAMPSTEDLSNNISEDSDLDVRDKSQAENLAVPVHELSEDIINEVKIAPSEEIQDQDMDANNVLKEDNNDVSGCESIQEFGSKSGVNALLEDHNPDNNVYCDNSNQISSVSEETQKHSYDPNNSTVLEDGHESAQTCQEMSEFDHKLDYKVVENNEIKDTIESVKISEHNFDDTMVEPACGEIPGDTSVSDEIHEGDHIHNNRTVEEGDEIAHCEEMQNHDHNPDDNIVDKNIDEIKVTSEEIPDHDSVNNSTTNETIPTCEKLQKDDHNSDDTVIQNALNDSKTGKKRGRKPKRKSCPKIKISVSKKVDNLGSDSSSQNWYVSERKESTDSTQSEEQLTKDKLVGSKRGRKVAAKSSLPVNTLGKDERVCFETVAEVHAVDTDRNPSCDEVPSEMNAISGEVVSDNDLSNLVKDDASTVSSKMDKTCSVVLSAADSSNDTHANEVSSRPAKSHNKRKSSCLKPSTDLLVKVKEEPVDVSAESVLEHPNVTVNIKLENEEIAKSMDQITAETTHLPSRRGRPSSTANKKLKFDMTATEASEENQVQKKVIKKTSSKGIADSPSGSPSKLPEIGTVYSVGTPASCPRNRKKSYSTEAVIVPFSLGWMRELVHRSTESKSGQRMSDVYYFSPEGTKLRSMIEISNYLSRHPECTLTIENFTYWKELIYREPFEIQRSAKQKSSFGTPSGKIETSNQASIKKYLQSSTTPKKTSISVGNKSTPASSNAKKNAKTSVSNSDGNIDANESEKSSKLRVKSPVAPNAKKKADESANDSSSIMDTVENSDSSSSKPSRRVVKKVPFDNSFDDKSQPRPKRGRPSKSLNTSVPEPEFTKTVNAIKFSSVISQSDSSKSVVAGNSTILSKNYSKSTAPKRRPKLKLVFSKNNTS